MNNNVVYRSGTGHVVYQPNAEIEMYLPAMEQQSPALPNGETLLVIPASRPVFSTLREAWEWHRKIYEEAIQRQHDQVEQNSQQVLQAFAKQLGEDVKPPRKLKLQA